MLGLKLKTDTRWVNIVESNIDEILTDHAFCEQKAASNAISIIVNHPEYPELVEKMLAIAIEELKHFQLVHELIRERGQVLGRERKDNYVNELMKFIKIPNRDRVEVLVDRLLLAAMIEARSCERFRVLSENIKDEKLAKFYRDLMISEAEHYTTFITFARDLGKGVDVEKRWEEFLEYESIVIGNYGNEERVHG